MCYSQFMRQLAKGLENKIVAYDDNEGQSGCTIYLHGRKHAIFVPDEIIALKQEEAIRLLRASIAENTLEASCLIVKDTGDSLIFEIRGNG